MQREIDLFSRVMTEYRGKILVITLDSRSASLLFLEDAVDLLGELWLAFDLVLMESLLTDLPPDFTGVLD